MKYLLIFITFLLISCVSKKNITDNQISMSNPYFEMDSTVIDNIEDIRIEEDNLMMVGSPKEDYSLYFTNENKVINNNTTQKHEITNGQIIYKVPDTMQVMKKYYIIVRISRSSDNTQITENINGEVIHRSINTTSRMEVNLIDSYDAFKISKINAERQLVDSTYTEWKFSVIPLKPGINRLNLVVSIIKGDDVKQIVYSDEIFVRSNPPAQIKTFWYDNWKWSMEKILIPIITWLIGIWIGKRKKKTI
jgi:hypothetical protein